MFLVYVYTEIALISLLKTISVSKMCFRMYVISDSSIGLLSGACDHLPWNIVFMSFKPISHVKRKKKGQVIINKFITKKTWERLMIMDQVELP